MPRRYIFSPAAKIELAYLRRRLVGRGRWLRFMDGLFILLCLWVATIPLRIYVTHDTRNWIFLMMFVISGVQFTVWLRTLMLANASIAREYSPGRWDVFILTGMDAQQIVLGKWWAVIRYTALSHIFAAFLRLGLALAYAQYMHFGFSPMKCPFGGAAFCHVSWGYDYVWNGINLRLHYTELQPALWKIVLAAVILIAFSLLEVALLSAIGIMSALLMPRNLRLLTALLLRGILFLGAVTSIFATEFNGRIINSVSGYECTEYYYPSFAYVCPDWALLMETTEIGLSSFGDNGNFIAAMVMRPTGNDIFVLRNVAGSGVIGASAYLFLIWLSLRIAHLLIIRQKALRPNDSTPPPAKRRQLRYNSS